MVAVKNEVKSIISVVVTNWIVNDIITKNGHSSSLTWRSDTINGNTPLYMIDELKTVGLIRANRTEQLYHYGRLLRSLMGWCVVARLSDVQSES